MPASVLPSRAAVRRALRVDRQKLGRLRQRVERARRDGKPHDRNLGRLRDGLARSLWARRRRARRVPATSYPDELPISAKRGEILDALRQHQVVVVCGETGSGKSTQLPKMLLDLGLGREGLIGHTQPRRIAARTLSQRLAVELDVSLGKEVGYQVRFTDETGPETFVKLMTDGILLAETRSDGRLDRYDAIIVDEAHERSLNIDFLLGYLKRLLPRRPDLKLVITSATIDPQRFAEYFSARGRPAPIVEVSGRTWPVEVRWRPPPLDEETGEDDVQRAVVDAVDEVCASGDGDVLVFLPTQRDILETAKVLRGRVRAGRRAAEVLPLYARLPQAEQQRIFQPGGPRRIVLATNVAESSVTVPGIRFVIDTGTARISRYSARARIQRLPIEPVSRASADQRKGRCGRVGPGVCLRLYAEAEFEDREEFTQPEIQRSNLAAVILQMAALRLGRVEDFPFLDPPKRGMIREGVKTLRELGALDEREQVTDVGRTLARLPVDPRIGRMLLAARDEGCLADVLVIASALEAPDPRDRPAGQEKAADESHARFSDGESDFMDYLALWDFYVEVRAKLSRRKVALACRQRFLSSNRMREWADMHRQLTELVRAWGGTSGPRRNDRDAIHRALLAGLLSNVAHRTGKYEYTGADGKELFLWPGSALFERKPKWIVAAEVVETTRRYARTVGRIDPKEAEPVAGSLVERSYRDPFWDQRSGRVLAWEKVSLYGLPIVPKRRAPYDRVDPVRARELFIQALTEGELSTSARFLVHNMALANELAALEAKLRRRDLLADLDARYEFYDRRLPAEVVDARSFDRWRRKAEKLDRGVLFMSREDLLHPDSPEASPGAFPDRWEMIGGDVPLHYRLAPGEEDDGVTLRVTLERLDVLDEDRVEWLVPGLLREKVVGLIRSLPKPLRRQLVPVPERADDVVRGLEFGVGSMLGAVSRALHRLAGEPIRPEDFDLLRLDDHLRFNIEVVDDEGRLVDRGRDLAALRARLGRQAVAAIDVLDDPAWRHDGLTAWTFGELPEAVTLQTVRGPILAHPMLVDGGETVSLRLAGRKEEAEVATRDGLLRLACLAERGSISHRLRRSAHWQEMVLHHATLGDADSLLAQLVERIVSHAYVEGSETPRDEAAFRAFLDRGRRRLIPALDEALRDGRRVLSAYHAVRVALDEARARPWADALADAESQLADLVGGRLFAETPREWLSHVPRYLAAIVRRLERLKIRGTIKDGQLAAQVASHVEALRELRGRAVERAGRASRLASSFPELDRYRWMVEEYRVSVFAQELGTSLKVSERRLAEQRGAAEEEIASVSSRVAS